MAEETKATKKRGREQYSSDKLWARREKLHNEALERDERHLALSLGNRIQKAQSRRGESKKEIARLTKLMATQKAPAVKAQPLTEEQKNAKEVQRAQDVVAVAAKPKKNYQKPKRS